MMTKATQGRVLWVLLMMTGVSNSRRVALTDSDIPTPFLCTGANNDPILWSGAEIMRLIHFSQVIEIGARGIRFVEARSEPAHNVMVMGEKDKCESLYQGLCATSDTILFPTAFFADGVLISGQFNPSFNSTVSQRFARNAHAACETIEGYGQGRTMVMDQVVYTASSCDVMQGHLVTMYRPMTAEVFVHTQTLGPMAYTVILITALICIYGASSAAWPRRNDGLILSVCLAGTCACCMVYMVSGICFVTMEDEVHFWMSVSGTLLALMFELAPIIISCSGGVGCNHDWEKLKTNRMMIPHTCDCCIYMLGTITDMLYRSPETPYAGIFVIFFAIRAWQRAYVLFFHLVKPSSHYYYENGADITSPSFTTIIMAVLLHMDAVYSTFYLCLTAEVGLVPQYADDEDWPIYAGVGAFITFLAAWCTPPSSNT